MNRNTLISRLVSALSALAILNQVVTPDQLNLLNTIHPKASAFIAGLGVFGLVMTEASVKGSSVVRLVKRNPGRSSLAGLALICLLVGGGATKCGGQQTVRGTAAGVSEGAKQFKAEVELLYDAGDITAEEHTVLTASADEVVNVSDRIVSRAADWPQMSKAQRLDLAGDAVAQIGASVEALSAKNVGLKSVKAKGELSERLRYARAAVSTLRVIKAALPPAPTPTPTPTPTS